MSKGFCIKTQKYHIVECYSSSEFNMIILELTVSCIKSLLQLFLLDKFGRRKSTFKLYLNIELYK